MFARRALWADGLDYRHGTGHGVGAFLNVHEGPHGIGTRVTLNEVALQAGMTVRTREGAGTGRAFEHGVGGRGRALDMGGIRLTEVLDACLDARVPLNLPR